MPEHNQPYVEIFVAESVTLIREHHCVEATIVTSSSTVAAPWGMEEAKKVHSSLEKDLDTVGEES